MQDIECLARDICENPEEMKKFYELLGIDANELQDLHGDGIDVIDGAPILSHHMQKKWTDITFQGLAAVLDHRSFNRRDLVVKYCTIQRRHRLI